MKKTLTPAMRHFITHWGEMGSRWGINRTVAQVHALLYLSAQPVAADDVVECLGVARSNVSTSLKELQGWGIVKMVHVEGDRREHFISLTDVWEMFSVITAERKRREFDPTVAAVQVCLAEAANDDPVVRERLKAMAGFLTAIGDGLDQVRALPPSALAGLLGATGWVRRLLSSQSPGSVTKS